MGVSGGSPASDGDRALRVDAAFRDGDLEALRDALGDPDLVPDGPMPAGIGGCLEYAIYHSPLRFVRELLVHGADTTPEDHAGFPPLVAALTRPLRPDWPAVVRLLLEHGADPDQRGLNDYTALHVAVADRNLEAVRILLAGGADPDIRTRIDDRESPRELARRLGFSEVVDLLGSEGRPKGGRHRGERPPEDEGA